MRKVYVEVTTRIIMQMEEGIEVDDVISDMDYNFTPQTEEDFENEEDWYKP